ncbi:ATP-binding protein [Treponema vincentii]|uniref:ATP-binding protein n=1 Tax=Treponema vincentii TaxID=69710 RepID=UPI003D91EBB2
MSKKYRFILFVISILLLLVISICINKSILLSISQFWFSSGILLLILLSLIDQPHFSKDANIFVNAITASISLLLVAPKDQDWIFWLFVSFVCYLVISSYALFWIRNNPLNEELKIVQLVSRLNRIVGKPETLFSSFFLWGAIKQFGLQSNEIVPLFWYWLVFMILNMSQVAEILESFFDVQAKKVDKNILGMIFGVQSKNTFLVKLFPVNQRPVLRLFDFVEFKYSVEERNYIRRGMVFDIYWLNEEQWIKVLTNKEIEVMLDSIPRNELVRYDAVYKISESNSTEYLKRFIGIISENSIIEKIRFVYNSRVKAMEGQLIEVNFDDEIVLYQILEGTTKVEQLENKNQFGYIMGEAIQLGTWNKERCQFEQYGWVPPINTPIYTVSDIEDKKLEKGELLVGYIPDTKYPVILNMDLAITHHMAILGVTGSGKSVFSRNLIRQYLTYNDTKIIIVDFTGEYAKAFSDIKTSNIIEKKDEETIYEKFEIVNNELEKFPNQQNKDLIKKSNDTITTILNNSLNTFISDQTQMVSIIELPDVSNSQNILEYTKRLFKELFKIAKDKKGMMKKICIVLEEAHTVIPEWNFSGESNKATQNVLNSIAQIALQGRKYNVGLLVIAQRTANVSKTILTQCNTVVSFQEYDKTSVDFLSNYFGDDMASVLPTLRFRRAIAAGKAFKSNVPMIFEVPNFEEKKKL